MNEKLNELQKALDEVETIVWATCEFGSLGRMKMNVLMNLFSAFQELSLAKETSLRKRLEDKLKIAIDAVSKIDFLKDKVVVDRKQLSEDYRIVINENFDAMDKLVNLQRLFEKSVLGKVIG